MRLDEMIIKANADGKTYANYGYKKKFTYSAETGFVYDGEPWDGAHSMSYITGWEELPKRHLTVSEAEKELDCVIDTPDISKLLRPMSEKPGNPRNVIIVSKLVGRNTKYCGYCECGSWKWFGGNNAMVDILSSSRWIDPEDLAEFLPKE